MPERKSHKGLKELAGRQKKPASLRSLVAAVGATAALGILGIPAASATTTMPPSAMTEPAQAKASRAKLLLNKVGSRVRLAGGGFGHESHASHDSHSSHYSSGHQ